MIGAPNTLAYLALIVWPVIAFLLVRRLGAARGTVVSLLSAYLLLPPAAVSFALPVVPDLNRDTVAALAALGVVLLLHRSEVRLWPESRVLQALLLAFVLSPVGTTLANPDGLSYGPVWVPGMKITEAVPGIINRICVAAPLLLARALLVGEPGLRLALGALLTGTILYTLPMLVEVRLSPQINLWVYGFFQHSFAQMMRDGGFRPLVFLYHALWASFLVASALLAACALLRAPPAPGLWTRGRLALAVAWLVGMLVLCKSLGSLLYGVAVAPLVLFLPARAQMRIALVLALLAAAYPVMRGAHLVPTDALVQMAGRASPDRAQSLGFRFDNEEVLLHHAQKRPLFGWGNYGRHMVFDPRTGKNTTVADGLWVVVLGTGGWVGYLTMYGLLLYPLGLAWWRGARAATPLVSGAMLMVAVNLVDLIPNATLTPITWMLAGTILAWAERPGEARARAGAGAALRPRPPALPVLIGRPGVALRPRI